MPVVPEAGGQRGALGMALVGGVLGHPSALLPRGFPARGIRGWLMEKGLSEEQGVVGVLCHFLSQIPQWSPDFSSGMC